MGIFKKLKNLVSGLSGAKHVEKAERRVENLSGAARLRDATRQAELYTHRPTPASPTPQAPRPRRPVAPPEPVMAEPPRRGSSSGIIDVGVGRLGSLFGGVTAFFGGRRRKPNVAEDEEAIKKALEELEEEENNKKKKTDPPLGPGGSPPPTPPGTPPGGGLPPDWEDGVFPGDNAQRWIDSGEFEAVEGSSNVYAIAYNKVDQTILIQFKEWEPGRSWILSNSAGPCYRYFNQSEADARDLYYNISKGIWIWDNLRVRGGSGWASQAEYELISTRSGYIPRQAWGRTDSDIGYFVPRKFGNMYSTLDAALAPAASEYMVRRLREMYGRGYKDYLEGRPDDGTSGINRGLPNDGKPRR